MARHIVRFPDLVACARRVGVQVVEAPSSWRGKRGEMGTVLGTTLHWTGTGLGFKPTDDYPDFNVVKEGRAGLANSLSAFGLGRFRAIYVFSEELSWHAGTWSYGGTTDGNGHFLGIEAAGSGVWTAWQREVYPRLVASIHDFIDAPASMAPTHAMGAMPRGRKSDFPVDGRWAPSLPGGPRKFHDAVDWLLKNPAYINLNYEGADMPLTNEDKEWLKDWVGWEAFATMPSGPDKGKRVVAGVQMREMYLRSQRMEAQLAVITTALNKALELATGDEDFDAEDFKAFIRSEVDRAQEGFRQAVAEGYDVKLQPKE